MPGPIKRRVEPVPSVVVEPVRRLAPRLRRSPGFSREVVKTACNALVPVVVDGAVRQLCEAHGRPLSEVYSLLLQEALAARGVLVGDIGLVPLAANSSFPEDAIRSIGKSHKILPGRR